MYTCTECKETKPQESFKKSKQRKRGFSGLCKKCHNSQKADLRKTYAGKIKDIYRGQTSCSRLRKHSKPTYTVEEYLAMCERFQMAIDT